MSRALGCCCREGSELHVAPQDFGYGVGMTSQILLLARTGRARGLRKDRDPDGRRPNVGFVRPSE